MRKEYDFTGGVRGKYAARYRKGTNIVVLAPDVARAYRNSEAVVSVGVRRPLSSAAPARRPMPASLEGGWSPTETSHRREGRRAPFSSSRRALGDLRLGAKFATGLPLIARFAALARRGSSDPRVRDRGGVEDPRRPAVPARALRGRGPRGRVGGAVSAGSRTSGEPWQSRSIRTATRAVLDERDCPRAVLVE